MASRSIASIMILIILCRDEVGIITVLFDWMIVSGRESVGLITLRPTCSRGLPEVHLVNVVKLESEIEVYPSQEHHEPLNCALSRNAISSTAVDAVGGSEEECLDMLQGWRRRRIATL
jgi:hypothetical protein